MGVRNRLKSFRHQKEMNQKEFAEWLGYNPRQYNRWELNRIQPDYENAFKIKEKLELKSIDELFEKAPD